MAGLAQASSPFAVFAGRPHAPGHELAAATAQW
jgi:hypothetical protein